MYWRCHRHFDRIGSSDYDDAGELTESLPLQQSRSDFNVCPTSNSGSPTVTESISRCIALDRKDRYLSESLPVGFFHHEFLQFCVAYLKSPLSSRVPEYFRSWLNSNKFLIIHGRTLEEHCKELVQDVGIPEAKYFREGKLKKFYGRLEDTFITMARRLVVCERGSLGMAASRARKGDLVVVLLGCSIPLVLKRHGEEFELVGECYLDWFMNGEGLDKKMGFVRREFKLV